MLCRCLRKSEEQNSSTWSEPGRWSRANVPGKNLSDVWQKSARNFPWSSQKFELIGLSCYNVGMSRTCVKEKPKKKSQAGSREGRFIVVSNRLPYTRVKGNRGGYLWEKSTGGLITAMEPILLRRGGVWLGWDGQLSGDPECEKLRVLDISEIKTRKKAHTGTGSYKIGCVPIGADEVLQYYNNFSNGTLWGLFHYFFEKCFIDRTSWKTYCRVNERFARYIAEISKDNDVVWIQDFHLFMVPHYLRTLKPRQKIHFFLHIPFPHTDILDILPWQNQILSSLQKCDTVGFHHEQYLRNFRDAVDKYREGFSIRSSRHGSRVSRRKEPLFYVNPISIDFDLIDKTSRLQDVVSRREEIRKQAACEKILLGVDRIDYSKGIVERLEGIKLLLEEHPELCEKIFYYQLVIPSREHVKAYKTLKIKIDQLIGQINGRFSTGLWAPIHYNYGTVPLKELVALYKAADVALVTPLRDGMNLVCKEFVASRSDGDGVLVLSKFAGAIAEIKNCLPVNPYSVEEMSSVIYKALNMPAFERKRRMKKMRINIKGNNIDGWLEKCLFYFDMAGQGL
jgi:alpha,alpha-trehalose-phosphate synthase [UDP-forming]